MKNVLKIKGKKRNSIDTFCLAKENLIASTIGLLHVRQVFPNCVMVWLRCSQQFVCTYPSILPLN